MDLEAAVDQHEGLVNGCSSYQPLPLLFLLEEAGIDLVVDLRLLLYVHEVGGHKLSDRSDCIRLGGYSRCFPQS